MASQSVKCKDGHVPHPSLAFHLKCEQEEKKLRSRLQKQLKNDMLNLFHTQSYSDVVFVTEDKLEIAAHSSLLNIRIPKFYNQYLEPAISGSCQTPVKIVLPFVRRQQLEKFLRTVYVGEETSEVEEYLFRLFKPSPNTPCSRKKLDSGSRTMSKGSKQDIDPETMTSIQTNEESGCFFLQGEPEILRNGNRPDDDDNVSISDTVTWSGTLADLTDPFSVSTSDLMNVSTLNANDDQMDATSVASIEELVETEAYETTSEPVLRAEPPKPLVQSFCKEDGHQTSEYATFLKEEKDIDDQPLVVPFLTSSINTEILVSSQENDSASVSEQYESHAIRLRRNTFELQMEDAARSTAWNGVGHEDESDVTYVIDGNIKKICNLPIMVLSHESKDGDSGVDSVSRKLSTPSSAGHQSIDSDNVPDSPTESIPKDDSLEFCPDSLASEDANVVRVSPAASGDVGYSSLGASLKLDSSDVNWRGDAKEADPDLEGYGSVRPRKHAWPGGEDGLDSFEKEPHLESTPDKSQWMSHLSDSSHKKPSAVVLPYNASDDAHQDLCMKETMTRLSGGLSSDQTNSCRVNCSIKLDFVPFLKEERALKHSGLIAEMKSHAHPLVNTPTLVDATDHVGAVEDQMVPNSKLQPLPFGKGLFPPHVVADDNDDASESQAKHSLLQEVSILDSLEGNSTKTNEAELDVEALLELEQASTQCSNKKEGFFIFIDVNDPELEPRTSGESTKHEEVPKETTQAKEVHLPLASLGHPAESLDHPAEADSVPSSCLEENLAITETTINKPQPVYMFIDASSPDSAANGTGSQESQAKPCDRRIPFLRRRLPTGGSPKPRTRRPKSESAATLLKDTGTMADNDNRSVKRLSLTLDSEDRGSKSADKGAAEEEIAKPPFKLGEDLLKMFLNEVKTDVTIRVDGKDIRAHKSILTCRCAYFAAMLSGSWVESTGNVIKLQGFSYEAVHFALCHIYGGESSVPDQIEISELASLADMLGLEGLKEVVALALKIKYCHFFHKPCPTCTTTVSECLLIASSYGLEELQEKCLRWITKHMSKTWPTKAFAALPDEILQKCFFAAKDGLTPDTVLDTLLRCDKLMSTLPHVRWTEPVFAVTTHLAEVASSYLATNFADVIVSESFLALRSGQTWSIHALETTFLLSIERLALDVACKAYVRLHSLSTLPRRDDIVDEVETNENFDVLLGKIHRQVEHFLIHNANRVVRCNSWSLLSADLQKKIKDAAVIVFEFGKPTAAPPRLSSLNRKFSRSRNSNSTSSASPTIERARTSSAASALSRPVPKDIRGQKKKPEGDCATKGVVKASTLPRTNVKDLVAKPTSGEDSQREPTSCSEPPKGKSRSRGDSKTLPLNLHGGKSSSSVDKDAAIQSAISKSMPTVGIKASAHNGGPCMASMTVTSAARPKSWPARERTSSVPASRSKEKTPVKESPRDVKAAVSAPLLRVQASAHLSNGTGKFCSPLARPKSVAYNGAGNRMTKHSPDNSISSFRDSRASSLRKAASSDLHRKDKDTTKYRSATRPRSDDISLGSKKASQRSSTMRSSRSSIDK